LWDEGLMLEMQSWTGQIVSAKQPVGGPCHKPLHINRLDKSVTSHQVSQVVTYVWLTKAKYFLLVSKVSCLAPGQTDEKCMPIFLDADNGFR
jgi:hypothetical protein